MAVGYYPVETYRTSTVTNGGTTIQDIARNINESRTVADTKNLTQTELADVGGGVKFSIGNYNVKPIQVPSPLPRNPNTT